MLPEPPPEDDQADDERRRLHHPDQSLPPSFAVFGRIVEDLKTGAAAAFHLETPR